MQRDIITLIVTNRDNKVYVANLQPNRRIATGVDNNECMLQILLSIFFCLV